jgi:hypothetical protein
VPEEIREEVPPEERDGVEPSRAPIDEDVDGELNAALPEEEDGERQT